MPKNLSKVLLFGAVLFGVAKLKSHKMHHRWALENGPGEGWPSHKTQSPRFRHWKKHFVQPAEETPSAAESEGAES